MHLQLCKRLHQKRELGGHQNEWSRIYEANQSWFLSLLKLRQSQKATKIPKTPGQALMPLDLFREAGQ